MSRASSTRSRALPRRLCRRRRRRRPQPDPTTPRSPTATTRCSSATPSPGAPARAAGSTSSGSVTARPCHGECSMRLGFLTAPFAETPLMEVADWAAATGFEVLEIACWPRTTGPTRRYAGTSHIDVANLSASQAHETRARDRGQGPDHLGPRLLSESAASGSGAPRPGHRPPQARHRRGREDGRPAGQHVHGRRRPKNLDDNWEEALKVWPDIVAFARDHGRKLTLENCPMLFSYDEWPGGNNIAPARACGGASWSSGATPSG